MKKIKAFKPGELIPSNAKFIHWIEIDPKNFTPNREKRIKYIYEVPIQEKKTEKKEASEQEIKDTIARVINYLNAKTGSKYTAKAKAHASKIRARINEGATADQFKECIDNMCAQWLEDNKMRQYLRPETLFSNKFWGYITAKSGEQMTQDAFDELDKLIDGVGDA